MTFERKMHALAVCSLFFLFPARAEPVRPEAVLPETAEPDASLVYKTVGPVELNLFLFYPPDWKSTDRRAAIVFFFGGGWGSGDVRRLMPYARWLASLGLVAACADYRVKSRHGVSPAECVGDAKSAVRWLRAHSSSQGIDPARIVAAGDSAGGHLAAATAIIEGFEASDEALEVSSVPNALVLLNPVVDAVAEEQRDGRVGSMELAERLSPNLHIRPQLPPTLVLYGTADKRVLPQQIEEFSQKMIQAGNEAVLWPARGGGHSFWTKPPWREAILAPIQSFLFQHGFLPPALTVRSK